MTARLGTYWKHRISVDGKSEIVRVDRVDGDRIWFHDGTCTTSPLESFMEPAEEPKCRYTNCVLVEVSEYSRKRCKYCGGFGS